MRWPRRVYPACGDNEDGRWLVSRCMRLARALAIAVLVVPGVASAQPAPAPPPPPPAEPLPDEAPADPAEPPVEPAPDTWGSGEPPPAEPPPVEPVAPPPPPRGALPRVDVGVRSTQAPSVRYTLENIELRGNVRTRARVVLRYVPFKPGDIIDVDDPQVELTRYRLLGTGFFRDVQFSLRKGSKRGQVVLVIEVIERNTIVVNNLWMGLSADADTRGEPQPLTAYAGLDVAETNLAGTGITLGAAIGVAREQLALRVRFLDPAFLGSKYMVSGSLLYNDARDFFGNADTLWSRPNQSRFTPYAIVDYKRFGGSMGLGRDLGVTTQLWLHYRLESVDTDLPLAASHVRGGDVEPIEYDILRDRSVLSTLRATVQHDTRDQPFLPTRGWFATVTGELGLFPPLSDYPFQRVDVSASRWWPLPWGHTLRLELFGGAITGDAPFFEQYFVGDFTDFRPGRMLGLNFDRRPPPNFFDTAIEEVRYGLYAAKIGGEYRIPLYRGHRSVFGIDLFTSVGLYGVADKRSFSDPPRTYSGASLVPIDLTANLGFRMDTSAGGFVFAFANALGFIPVGSGSD